MTRKFTEDHEWLDIDGDVATIGITAYAQSQLGDLVHIELPKVGRTVAKGEVVAVVELVKAASEVYSPVSGEVIETNDGIVADPAMVNSDPEQAAWMFKLRLTNRAEVNSLMDEAAYRQSTA